MTALPLPPGFDARSLRAAGTTVVLVVLLAALGGVSLPVAAGLSVAAAVVSLWWRGRPEPRAAEYGLAPAVVATGAVAVFSSPSILIGALAGAAGLALLLWNAESPGDLVRGSDPFPGLLLPGLGLGIALLAAVALPSAPAAVGAAGVAVVIAFGFVVWALGEAWRAPPVPAKAL